jgi:hypothetical protein
MRIIQSLFTVLLAACGTPSTPSPAAPPSSAPVATNAPAPAPAPAAAPAGPASRDVSAAWMAAIAAKDARAIEGMLALPFTLYYDDNWTGKRPPECDPVRVVREIKTAAERKAVAACIAATVRVSSVSSKSEPIGIWDAKALIPALPESVQGAAKALSKDHVFVRGPSIAAGDYDFTLGVPAQGDTKAHLLVLWTING